jgi:hypothetical protein
MLPTIYDITNKVVFMMGVGRDHGKGQPVTASHL